MDAEAVIGLIIGVLALGGFIMHALRSARPLLSAPFTDHWGAGITLFIGALVLAVGTILFLELRREQIPDATPQLNVLKRVGGAIGTAVPTILLVHVERRTRRDTEAPARQ